MPEKKFEIYDGRPAYVEKRLQGHQRAQIQSVMFYNDESSNPNVVIITGEEETGNYPVPMHYEFKEWTLEDWEYEENNYEYYGDDIVQEGQSFYYLDSRKGVTVITLSQHFEIPDYSQWERPTLTIIGNTNGGTAQISGLDGWPEENINFVLSNGDDPNKIDFTGTKTELLATVWPLSDQTVFEHYVSGQIGTSGITTSWYSFGNEEYPQVNQASEFDVYIDYERPEEED